MAKSRDLFDDTSMTVGDHLESLRRHLWKAVIGLAICVSIALCFSNYVVDVVRSPIDEALKRYGHPAHDDTTSWDIWGELAMFFQKRRGAGTSATPEAAPAKEVDDEEKARNPSTIRGRVRPSQLAAALSRVDPDRYPPPASRPDEALFEIEIEATEFALFRRTADDRHRPITLNVQEPFLAYLKVGFVSGLVLASPWVFYQLWLFVAAGLYPHERRYVHVFLPASIGLFVGGAVFCFFAVLPFALDFLLRFNQLLGAVPQIRLSEWISFAILMPVMFGLSFQLPLVMMFLERISIFDAAAYRDKRRVAILVIALISMLMTPIDPWSMLLMMVPLIGLYELGILLCSLRSPHRRVAAQGGG